MVDNATGTQARAKPRISIFNAPASSRSFYLFKGIVASRTKDNSTIRTTATMTETIPGLTPDQVYSFNKNGYLVVPDFLPQATIDSLISTTNHLLTNFDISTHPLTRFTTGVSDDDEATPGKSSTSNSKHVGDDYFLTSNDKIRFFFEPQAFSADEPSTLARPKHLAVNKIGHSVHTLSPPFSSATHTGSIGRRNAAIAKSLGFRDPCVLQSMVICKQPGIGAPVPPHKDSEFLYTDPPSAVGWWIALQDAAVGNSALGFWKGSHKSGRVRRRFVRTDVGGGGGGGGGGTEFIEWSGPSLPADMKDVDGDEGVADYVPADEDFELVPVKAGSLVLIHGNVLHKSERNESDKSRFAYAFHVIEGAEGWEYDKRNWLQPPESGFTRLFADN